MSKVKRKKKLLVDCSKIKQEVDVENQEHFGLAED